MSRRVRGDFVEQQRVLEIVLAGPLRGRRPQRNGIVADDEKHPRICRPLAALHPKRPQLPLVLVHDDHGKLIAAGRGRQGPLLAGRPARVHLFTRRVRAPSVRLAEMCPVLRNIDRGERAEPKRCPAVRPRVEEQLIVQPKPAVTNCLERALKLRAVKKQGCR